MTTKKTVAIANPTTVRLIYFRFGSPPVHPSVRPLDFLRIDNSRDVHEARLPSACRGLCAFEVKIMKKQSNKTPPHKKTYHQKHFSTTTAANSRRLATKSSPRVVSRSSLASVDVGLAEIGHVQLSQSMLDVKTTDTRH